MLILVLLETGRRVEVRREKTGKRRFASDIKKDSVGEGEEERGNKSQVSRIYGTATASDRDSSSSELRDKKLRSLMALMDHRGAASLRELPDWHGYSAG